MSNTSSSSRGIGLPSLLTVLFVGLKLTGNINWSWVWVLSPLWISASLWLVFAIGVFAMVAAFLKQS